MIEAQDILDFWIDEIGPTGWYRQDACLDRIIMERFEWAWDVARRGGFDGWLYKPAPTLALLLLLDQFPRNMFRGTAKAFTSDKQAIALAKKALDQEYDLQIREPQRQFFYLPLMHAENLADQKRCVRLMKERIREHTGDGLRHAKAHYDVIREFGRFPYRNDALSRSSTPAEIVYLKAGGYAETLRRNQDKRSI